jgi:hypothetical protein
VPDRAERTTPVNPAPPFHFALTLKSINIVMVHASRELTAEDLTMFWTHPVAAPLPIDALRLKLDGIEANFARSRSQSTRTTFLIRSAMLTETASLGNEIRTLPILVSDANLDKQYATTSSPGQFPAFESTDWLLDRAPEGRQWKIKTRARVRLGGPRSASPTASPAAVLPAFSICVKQSRSESNIKEKFLKLLG